MPTVKQAQDKLDSILEHGGIDNALLALDEVSSMGGISRPEVDRMRGRIFTRAAQRPHVGVPYTFPELQARAYDLGVVIGEHI
jgi:hypothetical protein